MQKKVVVSSLIFLIVAGITIGLLSLSNQQVGKYSREDSVKLPTVVKAVAIDTSSNVLSPDGKTTLVMKTVALKDVTNYSFYIDDKFVISKQTNGKITIPLNTWSTNDKAFFVKEDADNKSNFWIEPKDINLTLKFSEKFPDESLQDVTGWAADNLLVVNANDGRSDISYWFETDSQTFIRLSTRFN